MFRVKAGCTPATLFVVRYLPQHKVIKFCGGTEDDDGNPHDYNYRLDVAEMRVVTTSPYPFYQKQLVYGKAVRNKLCKLFRLQEEICTSYEEVCKLKNAVGYAGGAMPLAHAFERYLSLSTGGK